MKAASSVNRINSIPTLTAITIISRGQPAPAAPERTPSPILPLKSLISGAKFIGFPLICLYSRGSSLDCEENFQQQQKQRQPMTEFAFSSVSYVGLILTGSFCSLKVPFYLQRRARSTNVQSYLLFLGENSVTSSVVVFLVLMVVLVSAALIAFCWCCTLKKRNLALIRYSKVSIEQISIERKLFI